MRLSYLGSFVVLAGLLQPGLAAPLVCPQGQPMAANIGAGVVMRSCVWEKEPGLRIRSGPLELHKNGILILKTQTNAEGKLHGLYASWSDAGELQEKGDYVEGHKEGDWIETDADGARVSVRYRRGVPVDR